MKPSLSVCIIAKNEESYIKNCISSVINLADEIIVLDTGSTDKTKEIVNEFNTIFFPDSLKKGLVKLYETTWENDNSIARNQCIAYATGVWVLIIDADERLEANTAKRLQHFIDEHTTKYGDYAVFAFKYLNQNKYSLDKEYFKSSLFKNNMGIKYKHPIHDLPIIENEQFKYVKCTDMKIIHQNGNSFEDLKRKNISYINRLEKLLQFESTNSFYYYKHLGDSWLLLGNKDRALECYLKSEDLNNDFISFDFKLGLYKRIKSILLFEESKYDVLLPFIEKLHKIAPDDLDNIFDLAYVNLFLGNHQKSLEYYQSILSIYHDRTNILVGIARNNISLGNIQKGLDIFYDIWKIETTDEIGLHLCRALLLNKQENKARELLIKMNFYDPEKSINRQLSEMNIWTNDEKVKFLCSK